LGSEATSIASAGSSPTGGPLIESAGQFARPTRRRAVIATARPSCASSRMARLEPGPRTRVTPVAGFGVTLEQESREVRHSAVILWVETWVIIAGQSLNY
jgi:hypothetical protein